MENPIYPLAIEPALLYKPTKVISYQAKTSWLQKHVTWMKADHGKMNIFFIALKVMEIFLACLFCFPLVIKAYKISSKIEAEKKFNTLVAKQPRPDPHIEIEIKSATRTFTHVHEILLENGFLWVRQRHSGKEWTPLYFDGFKDNKKPLSISADGSNLIVIDEDQKVHYRKLFREFRHVEITDHNKRALEFIKGTDVDLKKDAYIVVDKVGKNNWKARWFSLPVVSLIVQFFKQSQKLLLPAHPRAIAISHRGRYNNYMEDGVGTHHLVTTGVTTLYVAEKNGKIIRKFDPWLPENAKMNIHVPETATTSFELINMDASASHLMLLGYEASKNPVGKGIVKRLTIKTKLTDIDSEGWNPGLKYHYESDEKKPKHRVIAMSPWKNHPLDFKAGERVTKNISILQIGEGNEAREIRIEGWNSAGVKGYFHKLVSQQDWQFKAFAPISEMPPLDFEIKDEKTKFKTSVFNFKSKKAKFKALKANEQPQVILKDFGIGNTNSPLIIKCGDVDYMLNLHRKKTFKNFLGIEGDNYDLVIPKNLHNNDLIRKLFDGKKSMRVFVSTQKKPRQLKLRTLQFSILLSPQQR